MFGKVEILVKYFKSIKNGDLFLLGKFGDFIYFDIIVITDDNISYKLGGGEYLHGEECIVVSNYPEKYIRGEKEEFWLYGVEDTPIKVVDIIFDIGNGSVHMSYQQWRKSNGGLEST